MALELGFWRQRAVAAAQDWNAEAIRIGELVWSYCEAKGWERLDLSFNGIRVAGED